MYVCYKVLHVFKTYNMHIEYVHCSPLWRHYTLNSTAFYLGWTTKYGGYVCLFVVICCFFNAISQRWEDINRISCFPTFRPVLTRKLWVAAPWDFLVGGEAAFSPSNNIRYRHVSLIDYLKLGLKKSGSEQFNAARKFVPRCGSSSVNVAEYPIHGCVWVEAGPQNVMIGSATEHAWIA